MSDGTRRMDTVNFTPLPNGEDGIRATEDLRNSLIEEGYLRPDFAESPAPMPHINYAAAAAAALPARAYNALKGHFGSDFDFNPKTIVAELCERDLLSIPNLGRLSLNILKDWLKVYGLELARTEDEVPTVNKLTTQERGINLQHLEEIVEGLISLAARMNPTNFGTKHYQAINRAIARFSSELKATKDDRRAD